MSGGFSRPEFLAKRYKSTCGVRVSVYLYLLFTRTFTGIDNVSLSSVTENFGDAETAMK